jgi:hypothetical protein
MMQGAMSRGTRSTKYRQDFNRTLFYLLGGLRPKLGRATKIRWLLCRVAVPNH